MSATNHTSNYNLPIYEAGNTANWLVDFNGAMNTIDSAMNTNKLAGDTLKTDMEELQTDFQQVSTKADAAEQAATQASTNAANALTIANNATTIAGDAQVDAHAALNLLANGGTLYTFSRPNHSSSFLRITPYMNMYMIILNTNSMDLASATIGNFSVFYDKHVTPVKIAEYTDGPRIRWICDVVINIKNSSNSPEVHGAYIYTDAEQNSVVSFAMSIPVSESIVVVGTNITTYKFPEIPTILESDLIKNRNTNELPRGVDIILDVNSHQLING